MRYEYRTLACVVGLAAVLALAGCGDVQGGSGTLEVASVPTAEILIDGKSHGSTPATVTLGAGKHEVVFNRPSFESHATSVDLASGQAAQVDAILVGTDPADPEVIRALAEAFEIECEPFEAPKVHRGSRASGDDVVLLWPQKDVREEGLATFAVEVSLDYMGDGFLYFKKGRKVLHRSPFQPERVTTVAALPMSVREAVKRGDTVTWGIEFEDRRKPLKAQFKVVNSAKAEKAIAKLEKRRSYKAQPALTQALMRAQVLHNQRLYTESLLANLGVVQKFPDSTRPYQGIVEALRRLKGDESELWALASQFVSGKGQSGGARMNPRTGAGTAGAGVTTPGIPGVVDEQAIPLRHYNPQPDEAQPTEPATTPTQPGTGEEPGTETVPGAGDVAAGRDAAARHAELTRRADDLTAVASQVGYEAERLERTAEDAQQAADAAEAQTRESGRLAADAHDAYVGAKQAYEDAVNDTNPALTPAEKAQRIAEAQQGMTDAQNDAAQAQSLHDEELARVDELKTEAAGLRQQAEQARHRATVLAEAADTARRQLEGDVGPEQTDGPDRLDPTGRTRDGPTVAGGGSPLDQLRQAVVAAQVAVGDARQALVDAEVALAANPTDGPLQLQVAEKRAQVDIAEQAAGAASELYIDESARVKKAPKMPDAERGPAYHENIERLGQDVATAEAARRQADENATAAEQALLADPTNDALHEVLLEARAAAGAAQAALEVANASLEAALLGGD